VSSLPGTDVSPEEQLPEVAHAVAIIMDGNGRWATGHGVSVAEGHRAGSRALRPIVEASIDLGIESLAVYAFSTENWSRPRDEVEGLMAMFAELIDSETPELNEQGVRMRFIGRRHQVSERLRERMGWAERETARNRRMRLFVAFNYGGRAEILDAAARFTGGDEEDFTRFLYAPEMKDPDLLIRTSGEVRTSNFLLWQCAYSELVFTDTLWPDFSEADLQAALDEYAERGRRYGAR
jgi:undecaprenyl diphosphate synthase